MKQIIEQVFDAFKENREDVHLQWQMIDQLVASGKTDTLYELGKALKKAHGEESLAPMWAVESVYDHLYCMTKLMAPNDFVFGCCRVSYEKVCIGTGRFHFSFLKTYLKTDATMTTKTKEVDRDGTNLSLESQ